MKRSIHEFVSEMRKGKQRILAVTDSADRELIDAASVAVLVPPSGEITGSLLALLTLCSAACEYRESMRASAS